MPPFLFLGQGWFADLWKHRSYLRCSAHKPRLDQGRGGTTPRWTRAESLFLGSSKMVSPTVARKGPTDSGRCRRSGNGKAKRVAAVEFGPLPPSVLNAPRAFKRLAKKHAHRSVKSALSKRRLKRARAAALAAT